MHKLYRKFLTPRRTHALLLMSIVLALRLSSPVQAAQSTEQFDSVSQFVADEMSSLHAPGAVVVVVHADGSMRSRSFGVRNSEADSMTDANVMSYASLTKAYTAYSIEQLVQAHKLRLDDPVQKYLPAFALADKEAARRITLRNLLDHRSGIPTAAGLDTLFSSDRVDVESVRDGVRRLANVQTVAQAGASFAYSNPNYNILGAVIEAVTHEPYEQNIRNEILRPLQLPLRYSWEAPLLQEDTSRWTLIFGQPFLVRVVHPDRTNAPSAGLMGSAATEAKWISLMLGPAGAAVRSEVIRDGTGYSMGWFMESIGSTTYFWAPSWGTGSLAVALMLPKTHEGAVIFFDAAGFGQFYREPDVARNLAKRMLGDVSAPAPGMNVRELIELYVLPIALVLQIAISLFICKRLRSKAIFLTFALYNFIQATTLSIAIPKYGGSIAAGLLFAAGSTMVLLSSLGICFVAGVFCLRKVLTTKTY